MKFWMHEESGIVYDYDLDFPIGKINFDEDGIPDMLKQNIYIISKLIPIPQLKFYEEK